MDGRRRDSVRPSLFFFVLRSLYVRSVMTKPFDSSFTHPARFRARTQTRFFKYLAYTELGFRSQRRPFGLVPLHPGNRLFAPRAGPRILASLTLN